MSKSRMYGMGANLTGSLYPGAPAYADAAAVRADLDLLSDTELEAIYAATEGDRTLNALVKYDALGRLVESGAIDDGSTFALSLPLGLGVGSPARRIEVRDSTALQYRASFSDLVFVDFGVTAAGDFAARCTGSNNFLGYQTGLNTTGGNNNFLGYEAGYSNTTGSHNNFLGYRAGRANTTGGYNNFFSPEAGYSNTTGSHNNFLGYQSGRFNTTGSHSVFIGYRAGYSNTTGDHNSFIGREAGYSNVSGSRNVFLGYQAGYSETASNRLYVANSDTATPLIYGEFDTSLLRIHGLLESSRSAGPQVRGTHTASTKFWELGIDTDELITLYNATRTPMRWTDQNVVQIAAVGTAPTTGTAGFVGLWWDDSAEALKIIKPDGTILSLATI